MQDNKYPGPDGLTKAVYLKIFDLIGETLVKLSQIIFEKQLLTKSQRLSYSYITLLCKDSNNASDMKNCRPISLLNYDYKIILKTLTNRLGTVMDTLVHEDQTCAVKGRSIFDNVHLHRNIIDYVEQKELPCIFLNLDPEKAFDRVSYDFMFKCLEFVLSFVLSVISVRSANSTITQNFFSVSWVSKW